MDILPTQNDGPYSFEAGADQANVATLFRHMLHVMRQKQHLVLNNPTCRFLLNHGTKDKKQRYQNRALMLQQFNQTAGDQRL